MAGNMKRNLAAAGKGEPHQSVRNLRRTTLSIRAKALAARRQNKLSATSVVLLTFALALAPLFASRALPSAQASAALASDTFGRTVSNGWGSADVGGAWTILDNSSHWSVAPNAGTIAVAPNSQERGILQSIQAQDVDLLTEVMLPQCAGSSNCVAYSLARVSSGASPTYYRIGLAQSTSVSTVRVRTQRSDGTNVARDLATSIPAVNGAILWLHVQIQGINPTTLRARAWQNGSSEPSVWLLNVNDSNTAQQISNGNLGVRVRNEDASAGHIFQYLDYQALPLNSTPTPTPTPTPSSSPPPSPSPTPSIAVADAFNRSVTNAWGTGDVGSVETVIDTADNWSVSPGAGRITVGAGGQERAVLGSISVQDVDLLAEMQLPRCGGTANCFGFVMGRYAAGTPTYYRIGAVQGPRSTVFLRTQRSDGSYIVGDLDTAIAAVDGVTLWVPAEVEGINPTKLPARVSQAGAPQLAARR